MKETKLIVPILYSLIIILCFGSNAISDTFTDDFTTDSRGEYTVVDTETYGGLGEFLYDGVGQRLRVNTGDDVGQEFSHGLPTLEAGIFSIDFLPLVKYPNGGMLTIRLRAGADSYYELYNTDGYGGKGISKYVGGQKVDGADFQNEYMQGSNYSITMRFSPTATTVEAFGEVLVMDTDSTALTVSSFEVELQQQDAYFDNIVYRVPDTTAPVWDDSVGICSAEDTTSGGSVRLDFGTATDDVSGSNVSYNIYYAPTAEWIGNDWSTNNVVMDAVSAAGTVCANAYTVAGLISGTEYTVGVRVADESGNEDTNTATVTVTPTGEMPASFTDDFTTDSRGEYTVVDTETYGGLGEFLYDGVGQRLLVNTGDNVGQEFSHGLPTLEAGIFSIDFLPLVKYPNGGMLTIRLRAGADSYYELYNTDGYGGKGISKYVGGQKVDGADFQNEYMQGSNYSITMRFSPTATTVEAFGEVLVMDTDSTALTVSSFEVELQQQDAYFDNIVYRVPDTTAPVWDDSVGICSAEDTTSGGSVRLDFGTATDDVSGSNVSYNIYYAPTAEWIGNDWSTNNVVMDAVSAAGTVCANAYTVAGLISGTEYTVGVRVADESGNEDTNTATVTVTPTGEMPASFTDDFTTDSRGEYTVVDTETYGGLGEFLYDGVGQRLLVNTGDNVGQEFSHGLPTLEAGIFSIDFLPLVKYPNGGMLTIRLRAGADSYYELYNTDGYGGKGISKYVGGQKVDGADFQNEYMQGSNYSITMRFSPTATTVEAFGEVLVMDTDSTALTVSSFEVELQQQDAYFDNIVYRVPDTTAPVWDDSVGICSAEDTTSGGSVRLDFGTATDDVSGSNVSYNIYYAPTAEWIGNDWSTNNVVMDAVSAAGTVCANAYTVAGLISGTEYTVGVRVADESGNEDTNTATVTVTPTGEMPASFTDDFTTDSRGEYTVVDTETYGGLGEFLYDGVGQRLLVNTGDNVGQEFSHGLPTLEAGIFSIDFLPLVKYPNGGMLTIRLRAGADSYYELYNTDGYGGKGISKYVGGQKVDGADFQNEYMQGSNYSITMRFSPTATTVEAFGEVLVMDTDSTALTVSSFEVELQQQDAYFDNIILPDPFIFIGHPKSYHLQTSTDLLAQAFTGNMQSGWGVKFILEDKTTNDQQIVYDFTEPFENTFTDLIKREYLIEAFVVDGSNNPISGEFTYDIKDSVGVGDYYVAFGDSITFGVGDDLPLDNISQDLRNNGGGYLPILNDLISIEKGYPHTVVNEGVGGEESIDGLFRIQDVIDAHPEAQYFLIFFGTNDSHGTLPVPSGWFADEERLLNPGEAGYDGSFLDNMQQIIDAVLTAGKELIIAKVPITLGPCSTCAPFAGDPDTAIRNSQIKEYNLVIQGLKNDAANNITVQPPDFYGLFNEDVSSGKRYDFEYFDNLHPNGTGYQSMADSWFSALTSPIAGDN